MTKNPEILNSEIEEPNSSLKKTIRKKWMRIAFSPIFIVLVYLIAKYTGTLNNIVTIGIPIGITIGTLLRILTVEKNLVYIYRYSIEKQFLSIYLVNIFGKKETKIVLLSEIKKSKFRKRNFWRDSDKLWLQISESVNEFYFFGKDVGKNLINDLNNIKKKN